MRTAVFIFMLSACADSQYTFIAQSLPLQNPAAGGALGEGLATAVDGFSKHHWVSFTEQEACFESRLEDLQADMVTPQKPFVLMGFKDKAQPLSTVAQITSSKVEIKSVGQEKVETTERAMAFPHVDVVVCFANPGRVVTNETTYVVLKVPYSSDNESAGASGSRDGIWRLTR